MTTDITRRTVLSGIAVTGGVLAVAACGGSGTSSDAASGSALATLADIPVGSAVSGKDAGGAAIIIARPTDATAVAFSAKCTHMGCTVAPAGAELDCPCHGSRFDALTGAVLAGPAKASLRPVAVTVSDGSVVQAT